MRHFIKLLFMLFCGYGSAVASITDYQQTFIPGYGNDRMQIAIRTYYRDNTPYFLVVNPHTLQTHEVPAKAFREQRDMTQIKTTPTRFYSWEQLKNSAYVHALLAYTKSPLLFPKYHNQGITRAQTKTSGLFLTVDLCPSTKPFEKAFFEKLVALSDEKKQPIPVAIAMSGLWLIEHEEEFNWIIDKINQKKLAVTWVNHSFSHIYYGDLPAKENFLLFPDTNISLEVLTTEKMLLEKGQIPSVFFRFPGLVSNESWMQALQKYGLIPVGSDAWLAAQQPAKPGSIILVHGNSNEPEGIKLVMPLLNDSSHQWLPLSALFHPS